MDAPPWSCDSPSPYPPSSPSSSDREDDMSHSRVRLRSSIALLPDSKLRELVLKFADRDPIFRRAVIKEVSHWEVSTDATTPTSFTTSPRRKSKRRRAKTCRNMKNLSVSTDLSLGYASTLMMSQVGCVYHPGHLEEDIYEFISVFPEQSPHVMRRISMWTCCDEDEWSPGCVKASESPDGTNWQLKHRGHHGQSHLDVFPDSGVEGR